MSLSTIKSAVPTTNTLIKKKAIKMSWSTFLIPGTTLPMLRLRNLTTPMFTLPSPLFSPTPASKISFMVKTQTSILLETMDGNLCAELNKETCGIPLKIMLWDLRLMEIAIITTMVAPILSHASTTMKTLIKFSLLQALLEIRFLLGFRLPKTMLLNCTEHINSEALLLLLIKLEAIKLVGTIDLIMLKTL